jgi:hypothetical protein
MQQPHPHQPTLQLPHSIHGPSAQREADDAVGTGTGTGTGTGVGAAARTELARSGRGSSGIEDLRRQVVDGESLNCARLWGSSSNASSVCNLCDRPSRTVSMWMVRLPGVMHQNSRGPLRTQ